MSTFNKHFVGLTRYPLGSIRELLMVALPLMLMGASGCLMHFLDRIILARYSLEAMNIAVVASMPSICWSI
jgi:MATE family multidrug resistance protein